jgi:hypothetical protein
MQPRVSIVLLSGKAYIGALDLVPFLNASKGHIRSGFHLLPLGIGDNFDAPQRPLGITAFRLIWAIP